MTGRNGALTPGATTRPHAPATFFLVDQQCACRHLLHVEHRTDLAGELVLDLVALVEHERDVALGAVAAPADDLAQDAEQLDEAQFPNIIASADALVHCEHVDVYYSRGIDLLVRGTKDVQPA